MPSTPELVNRIDKDQLQQVSSTHSVSSNVQYELDGIEDADAVDDIYSRANAPAPGFTKNDQKDMYRMGKVQELKVRNQRN